MFLTKYFVLLSVFVIYSHACYASMNTHDDNDDNVKGEYNVDSIYEEKPIK